MNDESGHTIRIRGLPFDVTKQEISDFFVDINISNGLHGIRFDTDNRGQALIRFKTDQDYQRSFSFHNKYLGDRFIEGNICLRR